MNAILDNFRLALGTFIAHPMRTALTLLGIIIGATTVVAMMGLLEGLRTKMVNDMSGLGSTAFQVQRHGEGRWDWSEIAKRPVLTRADRDALVQLPSVAAATGEAFQGGEKLQTPENSTQPNVLIWGATPTALLTNALELDQGRFFGDADEGDRRQVVALGADVVELLFPSGGALGQTVRIRGRPFEVVGLLKRQGAGLMGGSRDSMVLIPLSAFEDLFGNRRSLNISMNAVDTDSMERAQEEARLLMRRRHNLQPQDPDDFAIVSNESSTRMVRQLSTGLTAGSFAICMLSLLVGGIGILNIMLVSVTERTKEIGVRKALGARKRRILAQFATEAMFLSFLGGVVGVLLGVGLSNLGGWILELPTQVPAWAAWVSLGMSLAVGLSFGIYPASRAASLDPVEAMRAD